MSVSCNNVLCFPHRKHGLQRLTEVVIVSAIPAPSPEPAEVLDKSMMKSMSTRLAEGAGEGKSRVSHAFSNISGFCVGGHAGED